MDSLWKRIPANAVDAWSAEAMQGLLRAQYGRPVGDGTPGAESTNAQSDAAVVFDFADDASAPPLPILIGGIGRLGAGRSGRNFTPIPDVFQPFQPWKNQMTHGLMGLRDALTEKLAPSMYFPHQECLNTCARGRPEQMEEFCRKHASGANWKRCERAVMDLENGDIGSCSGKCNAMHHNWGK